MGAHVGAEVCRAEAGAAGVTVGVGLQANTGVSIGPTGISADFLGFGFSIGAKTRVSLPFFDIGFG